MKIIKNNDAIKGSNSDECKTIEYSFGDKDIDLGLWDMYLMWNFEAYQNVKTQNQMGQFISNLPRLGTFPKSNSSEAKSLLDKQCDKRSNKKLLKNKNKVY